MARDPAAVAATRNRRVREVLAAHAVDALVVGRPINLVHLTGARRVLVRGTRPFAPLAVLIVESGATYVQSASRGGMPSWIGDHVYAQSWNPQHLVADLARIPGLAHARRIGVDAMTPMWRALLDQVAPGAAVVAVDDVLGAVRAVKTADELPLLQDAIDVARDAFAAAVAAVETGRRECDVRAAFVAAAARRGVTTLPSEGICAIVDALSFSGLPGARVINAGDEVVVDFAVVSDGYEAGLGRTVTCDAPLSALARRAADQRDAVAAACTPGATGHQLLAAGASLAYRYGFGPEPPLAADDVLADGTVVAVKVDLADAEHRNVGRDMVLVREGGGAVLTAGWP